MTLATARLPVVIPERPERPTQEDIPPTKAERQRIIAAAQDHVATHDLVPPVPMEELRAEAQALSTHVGIEPQFLEFTALSINNELWKEGLAAIPFERRLLLLPKCLRAEDRCPAPFDELGLLCKKCGLCSIQDLQEEAERMGYAVLVAEGSPIVMAIIETGQIEAIVGVSCLNVLRKVYRYMEAAAIPGIALPLLQDDCIDTNIDLDQVWDAVHLTSEDKTRRLDLVALRDEVDTWFSPASLADLLGDPGSHVEEVAQQWLSKAGKRWRPFLTAAVFQALDLQPEQQPDLSEAKSEGLRKVAVAVECFHKASLIHDDIEDGDEERYGTATLHEDLGVPIALNVGDFLLGEGYRLLAEVDAPAAIRTDMLRIAAGGHRTLAIGQGTELAWQQEPVPLKPIDVVGIFQRKTAPAFETALRLGATFAGAESHLGETLEAFSAALGIAYQIRDDLDDFNAARTRQILPEQRPTILWALAHEAAKKEDRKAVARAWCEPVDAADVNAIYALWERLEVVEKGRELLTAYKEEAIRQLRQIDNANVKGLLRRTIGKIFDELQIEGWCHEFETRNTAGGETRSAAAG